MRCSCSSRVFVRESAHNRAIAKAANLLKFLVFYYLTKAKSSKLTILKPASVQEVCGGSLPAVLARCFSKVDWSECCGVQCTTN
jgi:hypothetical protein